MIKPLFLPKTKMDLEACSILFQTSNEDIEPHLTELVGWLADSNWPVAWPIIDRLETVGIILAPILIDVLKGKDPRWKYFLLSGVMLSCKPEVRELCMEEIGKLITSPSKEEKEEEVDLVARDVMALHSSGNNAKKIEWVHEFETRKHGVK